MSLKTVPDVEAFCFFSITEGAEYGLGYGVSCDGSSLSVVIQLQELHESTMYG